MMMIMMMMIAMMHEVPVPLLVPRVSVGAARVPWSKDAWDVSAEAGRLLKVGPIGDKSVSHLSKVSSRLQPLSFQARLSHCQY